MPQSVPGCPVKPGVEFQRAQTDSETHLVVPEGFGKPPKPFIFLRRPVLLPFFPQIAIALGGIYVEPVAVGVISKVTLKEAPTAMSTAPLATHCSVTPEIEQSIVPVGAVAPFVTVRRGGLCG